MGTEPKTTKGDLLFSEDSEPSNSESDVPTREPMPSESNLFVLTSKPKLSEADTPVLTRLPVPSEADSPVLTRLPALSDSDLFVEEEEPPRLLSPPLALPAEQLLPPLSPCTRRPLS